MYCRANSTIGRLDTGVGKLFGLHDQRNQDQVLQFGLRRPDLLVSFANRLLQR